MQSKEDVFPADERELSIRREGLTSAARLLLERQPDILAVVFIGSILYKSHQEETHFDTDYYVISKPEFISTAEEVDVMMGQCLVEASERHRVDLPYPDAHDVVKVRTPGDPVILGTFQRDYGDLVVGRQSVYFDRPANRTEFTIAHYN